MENRSPGKSMLGHSKINSWRNKFDSMKNAFGKKIDIRLISEAKLDD